MHIPDISIAMYGRNDNYRGNFLELLKLSLESLYISLKNVHYEIVLVDYNPPKNRPFLSECLKNYSNIKHVIFSRDKHKSFIKCHLSHGGKLLVNKKIVSSSRIMKFNFFSSLAANISIKYTTGKYVLSTGSDNIFPIEFGNQITNLSPNIIYRAFSYVNKDPINITNDIFNSFLKEDFKQYNFKKRANIYGNSGNFTLMDRNSWNKIGGNITTLDTRPFACDMQLLFHGMSLGKKIQCLPLSFFSYDIEPIALYKKMNMFGRYIVQQNNIKYDSLSELGRFHQKYKNKRDIKKKGRPEWHNFRRWCRFIMCPGYDYFIDTKYIKRFYEIKNIFSDILKPEFLLK